MIEQVNTFEKFQEIVNNSKNIVFFGGAGVSTGSGIPDFRSANGLYNIKTKYEKNPEDMLSRDFMFMKKDIFFDFYREYFNLLNYKPNIVHKKLAKLEEQGRLSAIITQNIDELHQKAGSKNVYELHGTTMQFYCEKCKKSGKKDMFTADYIFNQTKDVPKCPICEKSFLRPNIVLYGEMLPNKALNSSIEALAKADTLIVCGTSLNVQPAASLITYFYGENLIIINKEPTNYDQYANVVLHDDMFEIFKKLEI